MTTPVMPRVLHQGEATICSKTITVGGTTSTITPAERVNTSIVLTEELDALFQTATANVRHHEDAVADATLSGKVRGFAFGTCVASAATTAAAHPEVVAQAGTATKAAAVAGAAKGCAFAHLAASSCTVM